MSLPNVAIMTVLINSFVNVENILNGSLSILTLSHNLRIDLGGQGILMVDVLPTDCCKGKITLT